jgi:hypothetical protein
MCQESTVDQGTPLGTLTTVSTGLQQVVLSCVKDTSHFTMSADFGNKVQMAEAMRLDYWGSYKLQSSGRSR